MSKSFSGGVPYAIDVNRLKEEYPVPRLTEGLVIKHEDFEAVIKSKAKSGRYYGVVNSWIGQMKNQNGIFMIWQPSIGVKVIDPAGILGYAETRTRQKITQTGKAMRNFAWVDRSRLDQTGQQRLDHQTRVAGILKEALTSAKKQLAVELAPVKSLPKPKLIRQEAKPETHSTLLPN